MSLGLLELPSWRGSRTPATRVSVASVRPALENLEERTVMASPASVGGIGALLSQQVSGFLPINVTGVTTQVVDGVTQLVAQGTIAGQAFTAPLSFTSSPSANGDTPILHLHLGPINLNVLGLQLQTSEICLNIDASSGRGQLLGNLLSGLAHALDQPGGTLGGFLGTLSPSNLTSLTNGLTGLLDGALSSLTDRARASISPTSTTNILHLSVGPLNLNLLGLKVNLDNCAGGPVTVDLNAVAGSGNLLGNILSGLAHLTDAPNLGALDHLLANLDRSLGRLGL